MEIKSVKLLLLKKTIIIFKDFMGKYNLKNDTLNETDLQNVSNYKFFPTDSKVYSDKGFEYRRWFSRWFSLDFFMMRDHKPYYFDSFGGQLDKFLLNQVPEPITYLNYKIQ